MAALEATALHLAGLAYEAALEQNKWPEFLRGVADTLGAGSALLRFVDHRAGRVGMTQTFGYEPKYLAAYRDYYFRLDYFRPVFQQLQVGSTVLGEQVVSMSDQRKMEFFNDYIVAQGKYHVMGACLARDESQLVQFAVQRDRRAGAFGGEQIRLMNMIAPHVARALRAHCQLDEAAMQRDLSLSALHELRVGIIICDAAAKVRFMNRAAERLAGAARAIVVRNGVLALSTSAQTAQVQMLIAKAAQTAAGSGLASGGEFDFVPAAGDEALHLQVAPLALESASWELPFPAGTVAVFVSRPGGLLLPSDRVAKFYGLTRAEAKLASELAAGASLEQAAERLSISPQTARTQLKSIFAKTGARRQSELVVLLLTGVLAYRAQER